MDVSSDLDVVHDDEIVYRRIPVSRSWFDPSLTPPLSPEAFDPDKKRDLSGLSITRAQSEQHPEFLSCEDAARGMSKQGYYIAELRVGDLRAVGLDVVPKPIFADFQAPEIAENPGHAEIPQINATTRGSNQVEEWKRELAHTLVLRVSGPYHTSESTDAIRQWNLH